MSPKISYIFFLILFTACVSEVDFDQANDLSNQPTYVASLAHFTFDQHKFLDNSGNEVHIISDAAPVKLETSSLVQNNLTKVKVQFNVSNQFNRTMVLTFRFYNSMLQQSFVFDSITIAPNTTNILFEQTVEGAALAALKTSLVARMDVVLIPNPGVPIDPNVPKTINVQLSGVFDFNFKY